MTDIDLDKMFSRPVRDIHVASGFKDPDNFKGAFYMNLEEPQCLQIFRTTIHTNRDEMHAGTWVSKALEAMEHHKRSIVKHMILSVGGEYGINRKGAIKDKWTKIVGEGSGPTDNGIRPIRLMHGLEEFRKHEGFSNEWTPGVLYLKGRMTRLLKPYAPFNPITGCDADFILEMPILSEVALGFREDGGQEFWEPFTIMSWLEGWLEDAKHWEAGKDW